MDSAAHTGPYERCSGHVMSTIDKIGTSVQSATGGRSMQGVSAACAASCRRGRHPTRKTVQSLLIVAIHGVRPPGELGPASP